MPLASESFQHSTHGRFCSKPHSQRRSLTPTVVLPFVQVDFKCCSTGCICHLHKKCAHLAAGASFFGQVPNNLCLCILRDHITSLSVGVANQLGSRLIESAESFISRFIRLNSFSEKSEPVDHYSSSSLKHLHCRDSTPSTQWLRSHQQEALRLIRSRLYPHYQHICNQTPI